MLNFEVFRRNLRLAHLRLHITRLLIALSVVFLFIEEFKTQNSYQTYNTTVLDANGEALQQPFVGGLNAPQFSTGDIDFDGTDEVILYERGAKVWVVYERLNNSWSYSRVKSDLMPLTGQDFALLRDFNLDGKVDIIMNDVNTIEVWRNVGINSSSFVFEKILTDLVSSYPIFHRYFDLPGIEDIDGDGDMDLLLYGTNDDYLEYWKNNSQELFGHSDSLVYQLSNSCWGHFIEDNSNVDTFNLSLFDTCGMNVSNPQKSLHVGSAVTILDYDINGVSDLLIGDVGYSNLLFARNGGQLANMNTSIDTVLSNFPTGTVPANVNRFPAGYWLDMDEDSLKDLVVAPNTDILSNASDAIHYYKNFGGPGINTLSLIEKGFLQNNMIDVGKQSYPVTADLNSDGFQDIIIGNYGKLDTSINGYIGDLTVLMSVDDDSIYYQMIEDFAGVSQLGVRAVYPSFGDLDGDGDFDLIIGDELGQLHLGINNGGLYTFVSSISDTSGTVMDVGQNAAPTMYDIDLDLDLDLIVGNRSGSLTLYENIGDPNNFEFIKVSDSLGKVDVGAGFVFGGFARPCFYESAPDSVSLWVSSYQGWNYKFKNLDPSGVFSLVDSIDFSVGISPSLCVSDLDNDGNMEFIIGNDRGGLTAMMETVDTIFLGIEESYLGKKASVEVLSFSSYWKVKNSSNINLDLVICDIRGRKIWSEMLSANASLRINKTMPPGIYFLYSSDYGFFEKIVN